MSIAPVSGNRGTLNYASATAVASRTIAITATCVTGNTLIGTLTCNNGPGVLNTLTVTDSKSNTWTVDKSVQLTTNLITYTFSCRVTTQLTSSDTVTLTLASPSNTRTCWVGSIQEFSGLLTSAGYLDQTASNSGTSSSPNSSATPTTANASDLVYGSIGFGATKIFTPAAGFSNDAQITASGSSADRATMAIWKIVSTNGTYSANGTLDSSGTWTAEVVTYKAPFVNQSPIASAGPDQTVSAAATVTLDGSASVDNDGSIATYAWVQTGGTTVTLSSSSVVQPTFTAPSLSTTSTLTFQLTCTDNLGATGTDTVIITVNPIDLSTSVVQVGTKLQTTSATSVTLALSAGVLAGHTVVLSVITENSLGTLPTPTVTDTRGNSYSVDASRLHGTSLDGYIVSGHVGVALQAADVITFNMGESRNRWNLVAYDVPNIVTASRADVSSVNSAATGTGPNTGTTATTTQANDFVFALFGNTNTRTYTGTSGWAQGTDQVTAAGSNDRQQHAEWYFPGATGTQNATVAVDTSVTWVGLIVAYKLNLSVAVPPTANAGIDKTVYPWNVVTLDGSGTAANGATITTYAWTQTSGPTQTLSSHSVAAPTFTATASSTTQTCVFSLITTDSNTTPSSPDTTTITILPANLRWASTTWIPLRRKQIIGGVWVD